MGWDGTGWVFIRILIHMIHEEWCFFGDLPPYILYSNTFAQLLLFTSGGKVDGRLKGSLAIRERLG